MWNDSAIGVALGLGTALLWAISPLFWSSAGRRIGAYHVNLLRLLLGGLILLLGLGVYVLVLDTVVWPTAQQSLWLVVSGIAGLVFGDMLLYEAILLVGARRMVQICTIAPVASLLLAWGWLGEVPTTPGLIGVILILGSISYITYAEGKTQEQEDTPVPAGVEPGDPAGDRPQDKEPGRISADGVALAVGGAIFIGVGGVLVRVANREQALDPFIATVFRVASAMVIMWVLPIARGRGAAIVRQLGNKAVLLPIAAGTLVGPLVGMLGYVAAFKFATAGVVSTVTSMSPLFIMPIVAVKYRTRIGVMVYLATAVAIVGVALIAW